MQVRENWAHVAGRVEKWTAPTGTDEPGELLVRVERVSDVAGFPNLLDVPAGSTLCVRVPPSAAAKLDPRDGASVSVDVRRGRDPGVVFANPETLRLGR